MVGRLLSFWEGLYSGARLVSGSVSQPVSFGLLLLGHLHLRREQKEVFTHVNHTHTHFNLALSNVGISWDLICNMQLVLVGVYVRLYRKYRIRLLSHQLLAGLVSICQDSQGSLGSVWGSFVGWKIRTRGTHVGPPQ